VITVTQPLTVYVTLTKTSGSSATAYVSPSEQTITQTLSLTRTLAVFLGKTSATSTATLTATQTSKPAEATSSSKDDDDDDHPLVVSKETSSVSEESTSYIPPTIPAGTYATELTTTIPVTETLTKTVEFTATVTDESVQSTRYLTLTKTLTYTQVQNNVVPTSVTYIVDEENFTSTVTAQSTLTTEDVTAELVTATGSDDVTSTSTMFVTVFRTETVRQTYTTLLATPYLNSTVTPTMISKSTVASPTTYIGTTTVFHYVTVEQESSNAAVATSSNSTYHWNKPEARRLPLLARWFE